MFRPNFDGHRTAKQKPPDRSIVDVAAVVKKDLATALRRARKPFNAASRDARFVVSNTKQVDFALSTSCLIEVIAAPPSDLSGSFFDELKYQSLSEWIFAAQENEMTLEFKDPLQHSKFASDNTLFVSPSDDHCISKRPMTRMLSTNLDNPLATAEVVVSHLLQKRFGPAPRLRYDSLDLLVAGRIRKFLKKGRYQACLSGVDYDDPILPWKRKPFRPSKDTLAAKQKFLCYSCSRTLPRSRFAKRQLSGDYLPRHAQPHKRFCIDCGIKDRIFKPGNEITVHGCAFRLCSTCSIPTLGRFCRDCNTCGSCLGLREHTGPPTSKCPRCDLKTLRNHTDPRTTSLLQDLEESIYRARALINILWACGCDNCCELVDNMEMQPRPMDLVRQGGQFEIYHFSQIGKLQISEIPNHWAPAIVRFGKDGVARVGFEDPYFNVLDLSAQAKVCCVKECGEQELLRRVEEVSGKKITSVKLF
jgi:hypothetical protein